MTNPFEAAGIWWIPPDKEHQSSGTLIYHPDSGAELINIVGTMIPMVANLPALGPEPKIVQGLTHTGSTYTCFQAYLSGHSIHHPGHAVSRLSVGRIFEGRHFDSTHDLLFRRFRFKYSNLHKYIFQDPFSVESEGNLTKIEYLRTALWAVQFNGLTIRHSFNWSTKFDNDPTPLFSANHTDGLLITADEASPPERFYDAERVFRSFINLAGNCQIQTMEIRADLGLLNTDITVYDRGHFFVNDRDDPPYLRMPVSYSEFEGHFSEFLTNWYTLYEQLKSVVNLYFFSKQNAYRDIQNGFLGMLQSAEGFHRAFGAGQYMTEPEYAQDVKPILANAIPQHLTDAFKNKLRSMLKWAYEYPLRKKLEELIGLLPMTPSFDAVRAPGFVETTVNTRNYFIHRDEASAHLALQGSNLIRATFLWEEIILALLLNKLGFGDAVVDRAIRRLKDYRAVAEQEDE